MASKPFQFHSSLLVLLGFLLLHYTHSASAITKPETWSTNTSTSTSTSTYVVQTNRISMPPKFASLDLWYDSTHAPRSTGILHTYGTVLHGFAVRLTADEAGRMSRVPGVSAVYKDRVYRTQTTRSPGFLGLDPTQAREDKTPAGMIPANTRGYRPDPGRAGTKRTRPQGAWPDSNFGDGIIIGFIDSGIWPERASFNDTGLGPVRATWKGKCVHADGFNATRLCNNKLVGARAFTADIDGKLTPRDYFGHGTHVSATAAGSEVHGANLLNFSAGNALGMAPKARIAVYKACNVITCDGSAIVAAIDAAVSDGVDIISISLGSNENLPFPDDVMAVATFGAERHGVVVVMAGGNDGPAASSVSNVAPWVTTVGATTQDRVFPAKLRLGNGALLYGQSLFNMKSSGRRAFRLVNSSCQPEELTPDIVMGAIVVCIGDGVDAMSVQAAGGAGIVAVDSSDTLWEGVTATSFVFPGLVLGRAGRDVLSSYLASAAYPVASIVLDCDTVTGQNSAPMVAGFSSRGPSTVAPGLLKPDIVAPGVNILAAWSGEDRFTREEVHDYAIISGTSMACPHVAGVAALIKKRHGEWSPAMVRSAMMTTAKTINNFGSAIVDNGSGSGSGAATPLAAGAGLVVPQDAMYPGLVYDAGTQEYVDFLCALNYTTEQMRRFVDPQFTSCTRAFPGGVSNLNYPSFVVVFDSHTRVRTLTRTVTWVSELKRAETYNATVEAPDGLTVTVTPSTLEFRNMKEQRSYDVEFVSEVVKPAGAWDFGKIIWKSLDHKVVSPVAINWA